MSLAEVLTTTEDCHVESKRITELTEAADGCYVDPPPPVLSTKTNGHCLVANGHVAKDPCGLSKKQYRKGNKISIHNFL